MGKIENAKEDIIEIGKRMYDKGLIVGTDGNISVRLEDDTILITGSGFCKGNLTPDNISRIDMTGCLLDGLKPARDIRMHLAVYRNNENAKSVVHGHPPIITGFSMSRYDFNRISMPEALFNLHGIVYTDYAVPISVDVARGITKTMHENPEARAIILANHGALTYAEDVYSAFYEMETLEFLAKAILTSHIIGNTYYLNNEEMAIVQRLINGEDPDNIVQPDENGL